MKTVHVFDHHAYHSAISDQMGRGMPVFSGIRQKGGGLGAVMGFLGRYAIPILSKYVLPHAKEAILNTFSDISHNPSDVKDTIKANGKRFLTNVGKELSNNILQKGKGIKRKQSQSKILLSNFKCDEPTAKQARKSILKPKSSKPLKSQSKQKPKKPALTKLDIFS